MMHRFDYQNKTIECCLKASNYIKTLKPIFPCDAKRVALGPGVGLAPPNATILRWGYQHVGI